LIASFFTALYMFRLFFLVFAGEPRGPKADRPVPAVMMIPVAVLGIFSIGSGWVGLLSGGGFEHWLAAGNGSVPDAASAPVWLAVVTVAVSLAGIGLAWLFYGKGKFSARQAAQTVPWLHRLVLNKYYVDELYQYLFVWTTKGIGWFLSGWDRFVIGGIVRFVGWVVQLTGRLGSRIQNGQAQTYVLVSVIGFVLLMVGMTAGRLFK
jgi:NADH-quinone oxidoreductase subunit L